MTADAVPAGTVPGSRFGRASWLRAKLAEDLWATAIAATLLGAFVRLAFVLSLDFPVNDGGMFYAMVRDLQEAGYRIPETTSYNNAGIPFAYPPLMFYVAAALNDLTGISLLTLFRILPVTGSILTIPAFFLVSRNLLKNRFAVEISVVAFALIPRVFDWQISGGGLTRSYGLLFALLAIHQATRLLLQDRQRAWVPMGGFAALSLLSHPEMGLFFAYSYGVLFALSGRKRATVVRSASALCLAGLLSAPWWATVMIEHGPGVLLKAGASGAAAALLALRIIDPGVLDEPLFPSLLALGFLGAIASVGKRSYLLPVWVLVLFLLEPRKAPTDAAVPLAMLVGMAVSEVLLPLLTNDSRFTPATGRRMLLYLLSAVWVLTAGLSPLLSQSPLASMSDDGREAADWAADNAAPSASFVIVSERSWGLDSLSEWFPVLSGRESLATAQGYEWLGGDRFVDQQEVHRELQSCGDLDARCLDEWAEDTGLTFTHVFIATEKTFAIVQSPEDGCCEGLRRSLASDGRYRAVFEGRGGVIFERLP